MGNLLRRQRVNVTNDIILPKYEFGNYNEKRMYEYLKYTTSLGSIIIKNGYPLEINDVDGKIYPEYELEEIWLFSELRRCKIYRRYRWDDFCVYTYRFKNKQELVWSIIKYHPIEMII